jgi:hypothetical protein
MSAIDEQPIDGCAYCGLAERAHGQRHTIAAGWHAWVAPDRRLRHRRMWFRRLTRAMSREARKAAA